MQSLPTLRNGSSSKAHSIVTSVNIMTNITLYTNDKTETCITCLKRRPA